MEIALTLLWWHIPLLLTVLGLALITYVVVVDFREPFFAGIASAMAAVPILLIIAIAWAVAGALK